MSTRAEARQPAPVREYLTTNAVALGVILALVCAAVTALAVSRAAANVLSPAAVTGIVAGTAVALLSVGWANALFSGAHDVLTGRLEAPPTALSDADEPFTSRTLWRTTVALAGGAGAWAAAGGGLVAVALDGRRAGGLVLFVAMAGLAGTAAVAFDTLGRRRGAEAARALLDRAPNPVPLRRRAWRQLAMPIAAGQLLINAGMAWLLFHDYSVGDAFAPRALTERVAMADVLVTVLIVCSYFAWVATRWGAVDAALGRVELDDPASQSIAAKAPLGRQGIYYVALVAFFVIAPLLGLLMPATPSLDRVAVIRAVFAAGLAFVTVGVAYTRGALNRMAEAGA